MNSIDSQITFCGVADLERTSRFWNEIMDLPMVLDQGTCRIYHTTGNAYLGFCQRDDVSVGDQIILTIVSDEVDVWHDRLLKNGVHIEHPPRTNPAYGIYHFFARDPDGYRVEIQRFQDADWNAAIEQP
ncbi:MAG: glyoxalase [Phycisphaerae bacterium]|nr:glyoxalase [Phycisphaerae bacterium]